MALWEAIQRRKKRRRMAAWFLAGAGLGIAAIGCWLLYASGADAKLSPLPKLQHSTHPGPSAHIQETPCKLAGAGHTPGVTDFTAGLSEKLRQNLSKAASPEMYATSASATQSGHSVSRRKGVPDGRPRMNPEGNPSGLPADAQNAKVVAGITSRPDDSPRAIACALLPSLLLLQPIHTNSSPAAATAAYPAEAYSRMTQTAPGAMQMLAIGGGLALPQRSIPLLSPGEVEVLPAWNMSWTKRFHIRPTYFAEAGLQVGRLATRTRHLLITEERIPDGEQTFIDGSGNNLNIISDTLWVIRTSTRRLTQHQYATYLQFAGSVGKRWATRQWTYSAALGLDLGFPPLGSGKVVDEGGQLIDFQAMVERGLQVSVQAYGQIMYHYNTRTAFLLNLGYRHQLTAMERNTRYGLPFLQLGMARRSQGR
jgi:hypothetical protein